MARVHVSLIRAVAFCTIAINLTGVFNGIDAEADRGLHLTFFKEPPLEPTRGGEREYAWPGLPEAQGRGGSRVSVSV